jgi:hypothetical protein
MSDFNWTCPWCERDVTISDQRCSNHHHILSIANADGRRCLNTTFIVCPNPECKKFTLLAALFQSEPTNYGNDKLLNKLEEWTLLPSSVSKHFPSYIPQAIRDDYQEACSIQTLSPKASATLSRRCLQGILRDYWQVKPGRLVDEIAQIKDKVESLTWDAIEAVRKLGNIGAHMEKDINVIVDVDQDEAALLISLVETLLKDWYVAREDRHARMNSVITAAAGKKQQP